MNEKIDLQTVEKSDLDLISERYGNKLLFRNSLLMQA